MGRYYRSCVSVIAGRTPLLPNETTLSRIQCPTQHHALDGRPVAARNFEATFQYMNNRDLRPLILNTQINITQYGACLFTDRTPTASKQLPIH